MSKKRLDVYGSLAYPLEIGCAAFIQEADNCYWTSPVKHFIKLPSGITYIETRNTHYVLHPPTAVPLVRHKEVHISEQ